MWITIQFMGQARVAAGRERIGVEVDPDCTARQAVWAAVARHGDELRRFLFAEDGQPRQSVLLAVGHRQVSWDDNEPLHEGASIMILPPIAGG